MPSSPIIACSTPIHRRPDQATVRALYLEARLYFAETRSRGRASIHTESVQCRSMDITAFTDMVTSPGKVRSLNAASSQVVWRCVVRRQAASSSIGEIKFRGVPVLQHPEHPRPAHLSVIPPTRPLPSLRYAFSPSTSSSSSSSSPAASGRHSRSRLSLLFTSFVSCSPYALGPATAAIYFCSTFPSILDFYPCALALLTPSPSSVERAIALAS